MTIPGLIPSWSDPEGAERAAALHRATFGSDPAGVWASPGRVNLIGEHTDYNAGLCLPIALPHQTFVALTPRADEQVRLVSALAPDDVWQGSVSGIAPGTVRGWVSYAAGPVWALAQEGLVCGGFDAAIDSCVPLGAGLSSSAAIEAAMALALNDTFALGVPDDDDGRALLARVCVRAENEVSGAPTGGMDQAASLRCTAGHALLLDNRDASVTQVPLDLESARLAVLVTDTRAEHALVDGQYAARRATCEAAARTLGVTSLREITDLDDALARLDDEVSRRRVRHVVTEIARTAAFADLVSAGRVGEVGPLLDASHDSLRDDYEVSCTELDVSVDAARTSGALGARMTGGGFGGSSIALVAEADLERVAGAILAAFRERGLTDPAFLIAVAGGAGRRIR